MYIRALFVWEHRKEVILELGGWIERRAADEKRWPREGGRDKDR